MSSETDRVAASTEHAGLDAIFAALSNAQAQFTSEWLRQFGAAPAFEDSFRTWVAALARDPQRVQAIHGRYYAEQLALWRHFAAPASRAADLPAAAPDPRFTAREWSELPWFDYLRRSYEITARWLRELNAGLDAHAPSRHRLDFYLQQFLDAVAPSNFIATNPEAIKLAYASGGQSLAAGLSNLLADAAQGRVSMTDERAFEVGRNIAVTPGAVVYRNELIELLRYRPPAARIRRRALLIVPPCINKFYILDLRAQNSFVRYALEQGLDVFMVSWRDIPPELAHLTWDDYVRDGVLRAIEVARDLSADAKINALGFCVGGTLLVAALAVLRRGRNRPVASLTLLASLIDFHDPGDIGVYVDEAYVERCESGPAAESLVPGTRLAAAFASLRANELVWRYVVDNYLKGRSPPPFDLLYWNSDSANLPGPMYAYYLRHMYLRNALRERDALTMCGVPIDVGRIDLPSYVLATSGDHIVPWRSAYASAKLLGREVVFVLGGSGHIAGVVNPPQPARRGYRTAPMAEDADEWLRGSQEHAGSWWPHWTAWIRSRSGALVPAPTRIGSPDFPELEHAPGRYVRRHAPAARAG